MSQCRLDFETHVVGFATKLKHVIGVCRLQLETNEYPTLLKTDKKIALLLKTHGLSQRNRIYLDSNHVGRWHIQAPTINSNRPVV